MLQGRRNLPLFGNLEEKASCVDDKTVLFRYVIHKLYFSNLPQIPYQKRPKSVLDTDNPYQVACLHTINFFEITTVNLSISLFEENVFGFVTAAITKYGRKSGFNTGQLSLIDY